MNIIEKDDLLDDPGARLGKYFTWQEHACRACKGNPRKCTTRGRQYAHRGLYYGLDQIREAIKQPIIITSGYRCKMHNRNIGGAPRSQHLTGRAADVSVADPASAAGQEALDQIVIHAQRLQFSGIKRYRTWVHLDMRETAKWWEFPERLQGG